MDTKLGNKGEGLEDFVRQVSKANKEGEWLLKKRLEAFDAYKKAPAPTFRYGITTSLNVDLDFDSIEAQSLKGKVEAEVKSDKAVVLSLAEALDKYPEIVKACFMKSFTGGKIEGLAEAVWESGLFVYVPKNAQASVQVSLTGETILDRVLIYADSGSELNVVERLTGDAWLRLGITEIFVQDNAAVNYGSSQELGRGAYDFGLKRGFVSRDGRLNWTCFTLGGKLSHIETTTTLAEEGASTKNCGLFFGSEKQQYNISATSIHAAPRTTSNMLTRGVLKHSSKAIYHGLIHILQQAPQSDGYQKADIIVMDEAEADPIPDLKIDNNDVKCSHGTTVGQFDKEQIFYLMSRGLSEEEAQKKILQGFFEPLIRGIYAKERRQEIRAKIKEKI